MEAHQRRHLLSVYLAVTDLIAEMEAIAREGRAAAAPGAALVPLPEEWWHRVGPPLMRIRERVRRLVAQEAPHELREHEAMQSLAATTRWLSILLLRLGEEIENLGADRLQRRYGALPDGVVRELEALQDDLEHELALAREELGRPPGKVA